MDDKKKSLFQELQERTKEEVKKKLNQSKSQRNISDPGKFKTFKEMTDILREKAEQANKPQILQKLNLKPFIMLKK